MTKRSFKISTRIAMSVAIVAVYSCMAHAQSADAVLCDRLAAYPSDPDKPTDARGVARIAPDDVATAIKFCKLAAASAKASRRLNFQLGRAYEANGQSQEAIAAYRKATNQGR